MYIKVTQEQGYAGFDPQVVRIVTDATLAQVTAAGWLNSPVREGVSIPADAMCLIAYAQGSSSAASALFSQSISAGVITLSLSESNVITPTIANHIAVFKDTIGTIGEDAATAINGGNIQAGLSGTAGTLASFPGSAANGSFIWKAINNSGGFNSTVSNTNIGQASVYSLPDPANAVARIVVGATATPFISGNLLQASGTGGLVVDSGIAASGLQILSASITLNQAAVQGMYATPFQIIAAPSAGHVIVPVQATIYTNFQTAAFANGGVAILQYDSTAHGAGTNALAATIPAAEITAGASQIYSLAGATAGALTGITAKGLFLSNQTGAFTAGNAASTVVITVSYYIIAATV